MTDPKKTCPHCGAPINLRKHLPAMQADVFRLMLAHDGRNVKEFRETICGPELRKKYSPALYEAFQEFMAGQGNG